MPGIASDRPPGIQIGPIAAIGAETQPTPAIADFMDAFRKGFLTVDDLAQATRQGTAQSDALTTQLQANDIKRKLAPGDFENARAGQALTADQIQAAKTLLPGTVQNALEKQTEESRLAQENAARMSANDEDAAAQARRDLYRASTAATGTVPPEKLTVVVPPANQTKPDDFETWLDKEHSPEVEKKVDAFGGISQADAEANAKKVIDSLPAENDPQTNAFRASVARDQQEKLSRLAAARADYAHQLSQEVYRDPVVSAQYQSYLDAHKQENGTRVLTKGTPEYDAEIRRQLQIFNQNAQVDAAKVAALPKVIEEQASLVAKAAMGDPQAKGKLAGDLRGEIDKSKNMNTLGEENKFANRILDLTDPQKNPNPSNAAALAALEGYIKLLDPNAVIRQGKLVVTQEMTPKLEQLGKLVNRVYSTKGGFLSPEDITQLRNTTLTILGTTNREARQFLKVRANVAVEGGIPFKQVFSEDQQAVLEGKSPNQSSTPAGVPAVGPHGARVQQNGRTYIWDGTNYVPGT